MDHARPGDWVLVAPGDYKTQTVRAPRGAPASPAAVLVQVRGVRIRGMSRSGVVVDGTRRGPRCSRRRTDQNFGPGGVAAGGPAGLNGVMVWKADDVWVQNLTVCNFLGGFGDTGNGVWWDGGDDSGRIGGHGFRGDYLTATSTYFDARHPERSAAYGIFSSNWNSGSWNEVYASNFSDSGLYIGACQNRCDQTVDHAWSQYSVLGYSGSNSGGRLVIENSQFDHNSDGVDTNSENDDAPPPQDGDCPRRQVSPLTRTRSCWVFTRNYVHDNNNPDVPSLGQVALGEPVGVGMSLSGARDDTVANNRFARNGAWGTILIPYVDTGGSCRGGVRDQQSCLFDQWGNALLDNAYTDDGFFGNPSNGDIAVAANLEARGDCLAANHDSGSALTTIPAGLQTQSVCNGTPAPPLADNPASAGFAQEEMCDVQQAEGVGGGSPCLAGDRYPSPRRVVMHALPGHLPTMPNPCAGVPANPWCPARR